MALADQSQQWYPTSVQVTVHQARNLRIKGKNGTNDAYAIMQVSKDKFSTSVAEKCIAPVWKEEASFDLPLFHEGNAERCTLYIIVMHRAQVGLDKHLGQAVVNLIELHDDKARKKTDWYKLVDKSGKEDKVRGEVLLDIQFMRNNLSASMFDLSMQDKPRSRISKLKDKVRGKKKEGLSDSASAIVPRSQVLTDSEGEGEGDAHFDSPGTKKKSKLKSLFAPKSNLQRNISQSMSTLGTLPEKNSSLSGSRSSGLNVDSPDVKKKFKFLGHKRTGSSDSKLSQGPFSLLGRSKQSAANDPNSLCINGSHVYAEEAEPKSGSTPSLGPGSSGQGSAEDVRRHNSDVSVDSFKGFSVPSYRLEPPADRDRALQEQRRHLEEEERRQAEETYRAEAKRQQEEDERKQQEEQERRRRFLEDDARRKKLKEEEEERRRSEEEEGRRLEEERRRIQAEQERQGLEEEQKQQEVGRAEEQKRQEEASMTDRLSTLFGMIRKKEEKKEEAQHKRSSSSSSSKEEAPQPAPSGSSRDLEVPGPRHTNPFEEIPLTPGPPSKESPVDQQRPQQQTTPVPSAMVFLNRTAKVSAVKPRLLESQKPETPDSHVQGLQSPPSSPPPSTQTSFSSVPDSPDTFSNLHSSLAPPSIRRGSSECPGGSPENMATVGSSPTMSEKKRQAPRPPAYGSRHDKAAQMQPQGPGGPNTPSRAAPVTHAASSSSLVPIREVENSGPVAKHGKRPALPPPDYDSLFLQKRHGVQGQTRWDHIIAEVNQKQREGPPEPADDEMSVDSPEEYSHSDRSAPMRSNQQKTQPKDVQSPSKKKALAPAPPKPIAAASPRLEVDVNTATQQGHSAAWTHLSIERPNASASKALGPTKLVTPSIEVNPVKPRHDLRRGLHTSAIVNDAKSVSLGERPTPTTRAESPVERPTPVSRGESLVERPTPVSRAESPVGRPAGRPTPVSRGESPVERPTPFSRGESLVERPTPVSRVVSPAERPTPVLQPPAERPTPVSRAESPVERPTPVSRAESPVERPTPVSRGESPVQRPTPVSRAESPVQRPTPVSRAESPVQRPTPVSRVVLDTTSADDQNGTPSNIPTIKPRQKSKESVTQVEPRVKSLQSAVEVQEKRKDSPDMRRSSPVMMTKPDVNVSREKKPSPDSTDNIDNKHKVETIINAKEKLVEPNPFPSSELLSKDPWALSEQSHRGGDLFAGGIQKDHKFEDQGMTPDDLNKLFAPENSTDPFSNFNSSFPEEHPEQSKDDMDSNEQSHYFKRGLSQRKKRSSQSRTASDKGAVRNSAQDKLDSLGTETTTSGPLRLDRPEPQADATRQSFVDGREKVEPQARKDPWSADPFTFPSSSPIPSAITTPEPFQSAVGESTFQTGVPSGGKTLLKAWVSPSEVQLSNNGCGPALTPRRPHAVKPLSSTENQPPISMPVAREIKALDSTGKMKVTGIVECGPYTQLTQEELISLVVKQQAELSKKDGKIVELEEYIDNLLVRVMEEKPSILLGLNASKSFL